MLRPLRRLAPSNRLLAVVYWVVLVAVALVAVFAAFWYLDEHLVPGGGMF